MSTAALQPYLFTQDEYLAFERQALERHWYLDGVIYAMAGESLAHSDLCQNLYRLLGNALAGSDCRVMGKDTKVRSGPLALESTQGMYSYPDVVVTCGPRRYLPEHPGVLENPTLLIEVLSPSTAAFDRGEKWDRYRQWLPSLRHYLLVAQDRVQVTHWHVESGVWQATLHEAAGDVLTLDALGVTLAIAAIYEGVEF